MSLASSARATRDASGDLGDDTVLTLDTPAQPASLAVIRHAVGGTGTAVGLRPGVVADLRLALSETCSAAIRRCGGEGRLEVEARAGRDVLRVVVRDGATPSILGDGELPLPLVAAITDSVELHQRPGGGTEVAMTFKI